MKGFNSPIKAHRLTDSIHKQDRKFCCIQKIHLSDKDRHYLRLKGWKTNLQANGPKNQVGVAILIYNKIDFQPKVVILIKGKTYQEEISILNIYAPKARALTFIKETLLKLKAHNNSVRLQHHTLINGNILETETE
jgi:exonuclease III